MRTSGVLVVTAPLTLVVQRSRHKQFAPLSWSVPGGWREEGELIIDAAKRELFEETMIRVPFASLLTTITTPPWRTSVMLAAVSPSQVLAAKSRLEVRPLLRGAHSEFEAVEAVWVWQLVDFLRLQSSQATLDANFESALGQISAWADYSYSPELRSALLHTGGQDVFRF